MQDSYSETINSLFIFLETFLFQAKKQISNAPLNGNTSFYFNLLSNTRPTANYNLDKLNIFEKSNIFEEEINKKNGTRRKEISSISSTFENFPFSYENCISSLFHNSVANSSHFKQSLLLVQTFFGMVEPIFIMSCMFRLNMNTLEEILDYLISQTTYEIEDSKRIVANYVPKLLESFLIRFLIFYIFIANEIKYEKITNDVIHLQCSSLYLKNYLKRIENKNRLINKFQSHGIEFQNSDTLICTLPNEINENNSTYTINDKFFSDLESRKQGSSILNYIDTNTVGFENKNIAQSFASSRLNGAVLNITDSLLIMQKLDQSMFGGISLQNLKFSDFSFTLNQLTFKESQIVLKIN